MALVNPRLSCPKNNSNIFGSQDSNIQTNHCWCCVLLFVLLHSRWMSLNYQLGKDLRNSAPICAAVSAPCPSAPGRPSGRRLTLKAQLSKSRVRLAIRNKGAEQSQLMLLYCLGLRKEKPAPWGKSSQWPTMRCCDATGAEALELCLC